MKILEKAQKMIEKYPLCNHCLGRQFAFLGHGLNNGIRGKAILLLLTMEAHQRALYNKKNGRALLRKLATNGAFSMASQMLEKRKPKKRQTRDCILCEGWLDRIEDIAEKSVKELAAYQYETFLIGVELPTEIEEKEDEFKAEFEVRFGENMRNELSREIGKALARTTRKTVEYRKPDIVIIVNPFLDKISLQVNPLYIEGRYRKLIRGIPQSEWTCSKCRGEGCQECRMTGKMYPESIEEIIAEPTLNETGGEDAVFHAAGREDVDARMLGPGRPYVIEVKKPRKRFLDLRKLAQSVNKQAKGKIKVTNLHFVDKDAIRKLKKSEGADKVYRVTVEFDRPILDEELQNVENTLANAVISQQTPQRVLNRRADLVREKHIYETRIKRLKPNLAEIEIYCQGGLYIKELITGDGGRTNPSVAEIVNSEVKPLELDVIDISSRKV